jgi:hypothetical protein
MPPHRELLSAGVDDGLDVVLADAGYRNTTQIQTLAANGMQVIVVPQSRRRKATRPGGDAGSMGFMGRVLDSPCGKALYRKRSVMIEPVFGHTKFNRGMDRFQRRNRAACRSEWRLMTATHNLLKLHAHHQALAAA